MMKILIVFTLSLISGPVGCDDVFGYSGGSIIIISNLYCRSRHSKYICKMENTECTDIINLTTEKYGVVERFQLYKTIQGFLCVFIRKLKPQDAGSYIMGVGSSSTNVNLRVVNDSCCVVPKIRSTYPGQNSSIIFNYPEKFERHYKYIRKLDNGSIVKDILDTYTRSQNGRFSGSEDRRAKVLSVNISDVTEADAGVYLCGVYTRLAEVEYYSYFTEIQLHVAGSLNVIIISVCVCVALLLVGGLTLMIYKRRHKQAQDSTPSSKDNEQVPPVACTDEEINHNNHVSASDTELYMNVLSPISSPDGETDSTVQPPQDQNITYTTVTFEMNADDAAVIFREEEFATDYATVQHTSSLESFK